MMQVVDKMTPRDNVSAGHRRTQAARQANKMRKWRRWVDELRENGWTVVEPEEGVSDVDGR